MKFQKQLIETDEISGVWGDCYRTALAVLMDLNAADVPHFYEDVVSDTDDTKYDWGQAIDLWITNWLAERNVFRIRMSFSDSLPRVLNACSMVTGGEVPYLLTGHPKGSTFSHVVVCQGDRMIWDPSKRDTWIHDPVANINGFFLEVLVRPLASYPKLPVTQN